MALKEEKVSVTSGKKKTSFRKETAAVSSTKPNIVRKNHNTLPPYLPSVSGKRSIRGKSNHGSILRQPCRYYLKGTCTRTPCEYWHPPECQFYKTKMGCKSGDTCLFRHYKIDEQQNKRLKQGNLTKKKKKESADKGVVAIVKSVSQWGCV